MRAPLDNINKETTSGRRIYQKTSERYYNTVAENWLKKQAASVQIPAVPLINDVVTLVLVNLFDSVYSSIKW